MHTTVLWNPKKDAPIKLSTAIAHHLYKALQLYIIFELNEENYRKILGRRHIFLDEKSVLGGHLSQVHFVN